MNKLTLTQVHDLRGKLECYLLGLHPGDAGDQRHALQRFQLIIPELLPALDQLAGSLVYSSPALEPEYVVLAMCYEGGINKENGAPFWGPNRGGYTHRMAMAGRYTRVEAEQLTSGTEGAHVHHELLSPELRAYLHRCSLLRGSEFDGWLEIRRLQGLLAESLAAQAPADPTRERKRNAYRSKS